MAGQVREDEEQPLISAKDHEFHKENLPKLSKEDEKRAMGVVSVIGVQGKGKSTFLNQCYGTNFRVNQESVVPRPTTMGVDLRFTDGLYLLDIEGFDSKQGKTIFDNQLSLFALYVSDVVLVNIETSELGHKTSPLQPLLRTILSASLKMGNVLPKKKLVIGLMRNPNNITENRLQEQTRQLLNEMVAFFNSVWEDIDEKPEGRKFADFFVLDAVPLRYDPERQLLRRDDLAIVRNRIRGYNQDVQTNFNWISSHWETAWTEIKSNGTLDTLDFQELAERERLKVRYQKLKPSVVQPWTDKMNKKEKFDPDSAFEQMRGNCLTQLSRIHSWTESGTKFITKQVTEDLSAITTQWKSQLEIEAWKNSLRRGLAYGALGVTGAFVTGGAIFAVIAAEGGVATATAAATAAVTAPARAAATGAVRITAKAAAKVTATAAGRMAASAAVAVTGGVVAKVAAGTVGLLAK